MLRSFKNIKIGKNNFISPKAVIHDNVFIGDNNNIYDDVIIYPNTTIGNNNNILPRNIIGEFFVSSNNNHSNYDFNLTKGVEIGNNNYLHVNNIISSGIDNKTYIGNNNKFLSENYISHDVKIYNNVTFYIRCLTGGYCTFLDNCNIGMAAVIHQKTVVGQYSMIGANNTITKHVFPYYININNKLHRLNDKKIPENIKNFDIILKEINNNFCEKKYDISKYSLSSDIEETIIEYFKNIIFMK